MHIFLSYSSNDRELANRIHLSLVAQQHDVFFDREDLTPGLEYDNRIAQAIQRTDLIIFLISPDSVSHGRYTLNELGMVQRRWAHPSKRVLPVMVRQTPMDQIPPYLKAVTILQPTGDIPAEVADHVRRMRPPIPRWLLGTIGTLAAVVVGGSLWGLLGMSQHVRQATDHLQMARSLQSAGEYRLAFDKTLDARTHLTQAPLSTFFQRQLTDDITALAIDSATAWLDDMRAREGERFSDLVSRVLPTLDEAIATSTGARKADLLAYRGWADFLRSRDSRDSFSPDTFYREAIALDSANPYAHAKWGHWIGWNHGKLFDIREHFDAALASGRQRPYVRDLQFTTLKNLNGDQGDWETLRVAHDMWSQKEPIAEDGLQQVRRIYSSACGSALYSNLGALVSLKPAEHIAFIHGLFPHVDAERKQPYWTQPCIARIQEHAGQNADALETYRTIQSAYKPNDQFWIFANNAIKRLSKTSSKQK